MRSVMRLKAIAGLVAVGAIGYGAYKLATNSTVKKTVEDVQQFFNDAGDNIGKTIEDTQSFVQDKIVDPANDLINKDWSKPQSYGEAAVELFQATPVYQVFSGILGIGQ